MVYVVFKPPSWIWAEACLHEVVLMLGPDTDGVVQDDGGCLCPQHHCQVLHMLLLAIGLQ